VLIAALTLAPLQSSLINFSSCADSPADTEAARHPSLKIAPPAGFLGGSVIKNLPENAGDTEWIAGPGRSHVSWNN